MTKVNSSSRRIISTLLIFSLTISSAFYFSHKNSDLYANKQLFSLNFKDVDIAEFVHIMSEVTKKNIVIDDSVRGTITINSSRKIPVGQAFEVMKSILELKGFAVVETENIVKVVPIKDAIRRNIHVILDGDEILLDADDTITYLLELRHSDVNEMMSALNSIKAKNTEIVPYKALNTLIISGTTSEIEGLLKIARTLDREVSDKEDGVTPLPKGNIHIVHLENSNAEKMAEVLSRIPFTAKALQDSRPEQASSKAAERTTGGQAGEQRKMELTIVADPETNSLIVAATPEEFREIQRIIQELDSVRDQVLIEALIVEVNVDSGWAFGIDWMVGDQAGSHIFGASSVRGGAPNYSTPDGLDGRKLAVPASEGFQLGYLRDSQVLGFALLNASGNNDFFNVLSTPQILTLNNNEAELNVGEEIAVPSDSRITDAGTQFFTFDYKPVGIRLKITPHITKHGRITLDLYQEVNQVMGKAQPIGDGGAIIPPDLLKRDIKTKVTVMDGKTIVVGGLIRNQEEVTEKKVPVLGDIPLLGWFFKRKTVQHSKTNLLVFITPHIVTDHKHIEAISEDKLKQHHEEMEGLR